MTPVRVDTIERTPPCRNVSPSCSRLHTTLCTCVWMMSPPLIVATVVTCMGTDARKNKSTAQVCRDHLFHMANDHERKLLLPPTNGNPAVNEEQSGERRRVVKNLVFLVVTKVLEHYGEAQQSSQQEKLPGSLLPAIAQELDAGKFNRDLPVSWLNSVKSKFSATYNKELPKPTGESFASWRKAYELRAQEQAREAAAAEPSANKRARNTHHGR
jgi:hypothetical protein